MGSGETKVTLRKRLGEVILEGEVEEEEEEDAEEDDNVFNQE